MSEQVEALAKKMRGAPLNKIFTDHKGRKSLGSHSTAWARFSKEWAEARHQLQAKKEQAR